MAGTINTSPMREGGSETSGPALVYGALVALAIVLLFIFFVLPSLRTPNTITPTPSQAPGIQSVPPSTPRVQEVPLDIRGGQVPQQNQFQQNKTQVPSY